MPHDEIVTILKSRLIELERAELWLSCLEGAGVDNWQGFGDARQMLNDAEAAKS